MRRHLIQSLSAVAVLAGGGVVIADATSSATAASQKVTGVSIRTTPDPVASGAEVKIYGQTKGLRARGIKVYLWHELAGQKRFSRVGWAKTTSDGRYEFASKTARSQRTASGTWLQTGGKARRCASVSARS